MTEMACSTEEFMSVLAAFIWGIRWLNVVLFLMVMYCIWTIYRFHQEPNNCFTAMDFIATNGRADTRKLYVNVFAALSVWSIVTLIQNNHTTEVVTLLPIMLGIFVGSKVVTDIFGKEPPAGAAPA